MLTFSPKEITKDLLAGLPDRSRAILIDRYGLKGKGEKRTLEAIGQEYGITRERVRQIENHGLAAVRASEAYQRYQEALADLHQSLQALGGVVSEEQVLAEVPPSAADANHTVFLLSVGQPFSYEKENADFAARWHVDEQLAAQVHQALISLSQSLDKDTLISEEELMERFAQALRDAGMKKTNLEALPRWIMISKRVAKNPLGEWGRADSPHVRVKSMRDFAYLTLKRHGSPMHFTEVAKTISDLFGRKAHPATCHNELINDPRFVLVGRGLYALSEWGYAPGVVRDVIRDVLAKEGPLTREEIVERVKRERYVKDATITVNLQDPMFIRTQDGKYQISQ